MKKYILTGLSVLQAITLAWAQAPAKKVLTPINLYPPTKIRDSTTHHGPSKGSLLIIGGNINSAQPIWDKFTELAGGKDKAVIVVVTTGTGEGAKDLKDVEAVKKATGIPNVTLLHTADLREANSERFIAPINRATGVYFAGEYPWKIADSYLNTLTHKAFWDVLNRGGVIAGDAAGASIIGSFLWRGDTRGQQITIGDHTQGLGFLKSSVIDTHLLQRNRQFDLVELIRKSPKLIGLGIDDGTAALVQRDTLQVIGNSFVVIYDYDTIIQSAVKGARQQALDNETGYSNSSGAFFFLSDGQKYDLRKRKVIPAPPRQRGRRAAPEDAAN
jgi:cyanophycinase